MEQFIMENTYFMKTGSQPGIAKFSNVWQLENGVD
jgi:hypothetical protein